MPSNIEYIHEHIQERFESAKQIELPLIQINPFTLQKSIKIQFSFDTIFVAFIIFVWFRQLTLHSIFVFGKLNKL